MPRYEGLDEYVPATFCRMYTAFEEDVPRIAPERFCEYATRTWWRDPVGQMESVYRRLGLGDFDVAHPGIERYAARTANYQANRYEISESIRLQIAERWAAYLTKYGYTSRDAGR